MSTHLPAAVARRLDDDSPKMSTHLPAAVARRLDDAAASAFALLDPSGCGKLSRVSLLRRLQRVNTSQIHAQAPRIEAWVGAMAKPTLWRMMFDAVAGDGREITQDGLSGFCREQAEDTLREAADAEAEQRAAEVRESQAAQHIQSLARGRKGRKRAGQVKRKQESATLIQRQMRRKLSMKVVQKKRRLKRRESQKATRIEKYRKEMETRRRVEAERYQSRRNTRRKSNSLSVEELEKVAQKTRQRAARHRRRVKTEKMKKIQEEEAERKRREARLESIPGFTRSRRSSLKRAASTRQLENAHATGNSNGDRSSRSSRDSSDNRHARQRRTTSGATVSSTVKSKPSEKTPPAARTSKGTQDRETIIKSEGIITKADEPPTRPHTELKPLQILDKHEDQTRSSSSKRNRTNLTNFKTKSGRSSAENSENAAKYEQENTAEKFIKSSYPTGESSTKLPSTTRSTDRLIVVRVYSVNVAAGRDGVGFRFTIDRLTSWDFVRREIEDKLAIGPIASIRREDGNPVESVSELLENDRLFALRQGERWPVPLSHASESTGMGEYDDIPSGFGSSTNLPGHVGSARTIPYSNDINMKPLEHSPLLKLAQTSPLRQQKQEDIKASTFEAPFLRDLFAGKAPTVFEIRENETLSVTSVGGTGRLVVSVYDSNQVLRVPEAVVFDSNAWFFLRGREAAMPTTLRFPGGYFYYFSALGPIGIASLSVRFVITSTFPGCLRSPGEKQMVPPLLISEPPAVSATPDDLETWAAGGLRMRHGPPPKMTQSMKSLGRPNFGGSRGGGGNEVASRAKVNKNQLSVSLRLPPIGGGDGQGGNDESISSRDLLPSIPRSHRTDARFSESVGKEASMSIINVSVGERSKSLRQDTCSDDTVVGRFSLDLLSLSVTHPELEHET